MKVKVYSGRREDGHCVVTVDGLPLDPRFDVRVLSADGFEWGYEGDGPGQLALAILADHYGDPAPALSRYKLFRAAFIAGIRGDEWRIDSQQIESSLGSTVEVPLTLDELLAKVRGG